MKLHFINEPPLEFGQGEHICPRAGITQYGVYDTRFEARRERILVGAVGTSKNLTGLTTWLESAQTTFHLHQIIINLIFFRPFVVLIRGWASERILP